MKNKIAKILKTCKHEEVRFELLEQYFKCISKKEDINLIFDLLANDADPCVRHEAAAQLYRIGEKKPELLSSIRDKAVKALYSAVNCDASIVVKHECIEVLGYLAKEKDLNKLRKLIKSENPDIHSTAKIAFRMAKNRLVGNIPVNKIPSHYIAMYS